MRGHIGAYAVQRMGAAYLAATVNYARGETSTERTIAGVGPTEIAKGRFASDQLSGRFEIGRKYGFNGYSLTPFVALEPAVLWQRAYAENSTTLGGAPGILGLSYGSNTVTSLPLLIGAQIDARHVLANGQTLSPYARLSWVHEFKPERSITGVVHQHSRRDVYRRRRAACLRRAARRGRRHADLEPQDGLVRQPQQRTVRPQPQHCRDSAACGRTGEFRISASATALPQVTVSAGPFKIARAQLVLRQHDFDRLDDGLGRFRLAEMLQHHRARPDLADRIGDALPVNIRRRAVHRLEHRRETGAPD